MTGSPEELARWLADNGGSAFGSRTASYEQWTAPIDRGWAPSRWPPALVCSPASRPRRDRPPRQRRAPWPTSDAGEVETATAALVSPKVGSLNDAVISLMARNPEGLTATETLDLYVAEHRVTGLYSVAPRLSQLERMGWLEKAGSRTRAGERRRTVYRLTEQAWEQLAVAW